MYQIPIHGNDVFGAGLTLKDIKLQLERIWQLWKKRKQMLLHYQKGLKLRQRQ
jgi:hypothetical protein